MPPFPLYRKVEDGGQLDSELRAESRRLQSRLDGLRAHLLRPGGDDEENHRRRALSARPPSESLFRKPALGHAPTEDNRPERGTFRTETKYQIYRKANTE